MAKKVFITSANKGIGYGTARHLGRSGWQVIMVLGQPQYVKAATPGSFHLWASLSNDIREKGDYSSRAGSSTKSSTFLRLACMRSYSSLEPTMSFSQSRSPVPAGMR